MSNSSGPSKRIWIIGGLLAALTGIFIGAVSKYHSLPPREDLMPNFDCTTDGSNPAPICRFWYKDGRYEERPNHRYKSAVK
jgi:hypothetical protein